MVHEASQLSPAKIARQLGCGRGQGSTGIGVERDIGALPTPGCKQGRSIAWRGVSRPLSILLAARSLAQHPRSILPARAHISTNYIASALTHSLLRWRYVPKNMNLLQIFYIIINFQDVNVYSYKNIEDFTVVGFPSLITYDYLSTQINYIFVEIS